MPSLTTLPTPRPWAPERSLRWGIIAPGYIAGYFAGAINRRTDHTLAAVGSRSLERSQKFAAEHGIALAFGSYEELVSSDDVDAVYIASPHSAHLDQALLAIEAGKHVLVEKPLATTGADAARILEAARAKGVLAMEAMWTRYLPQSDIIRQLLADGALGEITSVAADFGFAFPFTPEHRLYDPAQAGGALLDAGIYPVSFISSVLGAPRSVHAVGSVAPSGVDKLALVSLGYDGAVGTALTSLNGWQPINATISGTEGRIEVHREFIQPSGLTVTTYDDFMQPPSVLEWDGRDYDPAYDALSCEADAFAEFVGKGLLESPIHSHAEVVSVVDTLDRARTQILTAHQEAQS